MPSGHINTTELVTCEIDDSEQTMTYQNGYSVQIRIRIIKIVLAIWKAISALLRTCRLFTRSPPLRP